MGCERIVFEVEPAKPDVFQINELEHGFHFEENSSVLNPFGEEEEKDSSDFFEVKVSNLIPGTTENELSFFFESKGYKVARV